MSQTTTIPLATVIRASQALQAVSNAGLGKPISFENWIAVQGAESELRYQLNKILTDQKVAVE